MANLVRKSLTGSGTFLVPAGVKQLKVYGVVRTGLRKMNKASVASSFPPMQILRNDGKILSSGHSGLTNALSTTAGVPRQPSAETSRSVPGVTVMDNAVAVGICDFADHFFYIDGYGKIHGLGSNLNGQLGNIRSSATAISYPVAVASGLYFVKVLAPESLSIALTHNGIAYAWGLASGGTLGTGTGQISSPVIVAGGHTFVDIFAGANHAGGLKADGSVYMWGNNANGQLGDGTVTTRSTPVLVSGGHSFISVAAGRGRTAGVRSDGTIYVWGSRPGTTAVSSPTALAGSVTFAKVFGGGDNGFFALQSDGTAYGWGFNTDGMLGDNSTTTRSTPVPVAGSHKFHEIAVTTNGDGVDCAAGIRRPQGDVYVWGTAYEAQGNNKVGSSTPLPTFWGTGFGPVTASELLNVRTVTPGESIAYDVSDPGSYNELIGRVLGIKHTSFIVEFFA